MQPSTESRPSGGGSSDSVPSQRPAPMRTEREPDTLYLVGAAIFIASLVSGNLIFQKFFAWNPWGLFNFEISVGLLPYPITFVVTDFICEVYGKRAANRVVLSGFVASVFISLLVMVALNVPATAWSPVDDELFRKVFGLNAPAVFASMSAYLLAQFLDVRLFHFWKRVTGGRHLWLRNNFSTITSQLVDTVCVLALLCATGLIPWASFWALLLAGYLFKVLIALCDTPVLYLAVYLAKRRRSVGASHYFCA